MAVSRLSAPPVMRLLADPVRRRLIRELACGDRRVRELTGATDRPRNLVSYRLARLSPAGGPR